MGVLFFQLKNQGVGRGQVDVNNKKNDSSLFRFPVRLLHVHVLGTFIYID